MTDITSLRDQLLQRYPEWIESTKIERGELTVDVKRPHLIDLCLMLRDQAEFDFKMLVDLCSIDYLHYGLDDWETQESSATGFSRGVTKGWQRENPAPKNRFAVIYHLLSIRKNHRIRLRVNIPNEHDLMVDSVIDIWPSANWFEREAFDLFGILFKNHPDLRRILTDYGFAGHPFRRDFPLIGKVEARYDASLKRVIYEPVSISLRILEPKVIRHDNRYDSLLTAAPKGDINAK